MYEARGVRKRLRGRAEGSRDLESRRPGARGAGEKLASSGAGEQPAAVCCVGCARGAARSGAGGCAGELQERARAIGFRGYDVRPNSRFCPIQPSWRSGEAGARYPIDRARAPTAAPRVGRHSISLSFHNEYVYDGLREMRAGHGAPLSAPSCGRVCSLAHLFSPSHSLPGCLRSLALASWPRRMGATSCWRCCSTLRCLRRRECQGAR